MKEYFNEMKNLESPARGLAEEPCSPKGYKISLDYPLLQLPSLTTAECLLVRAS